MSFLKLLSWRDFLHAFQVVLAAILAYDLTNDANLWIVSLGANLSLLAEDVGHGALEAS